MELHIDNRETELIKHFPNAIVKQLAIGDIQVFISPILPLTDATSSTTPAPAPTPYIILERKTIADLYASIIDGRYREQKARLMSSPAPFGYIIEGQAPTSMAPDKVKICTSAIIHTTVRDRIPIIRTTDMQGTVEALNSILTIDPTKNIQVSSYTSFFKPEKKENMTPSICYQQQLMCIPGVSVETAKAIASVYPNMYSLTEELTEHGTELIKNIKISKKKLGQKKADQICQYLTCL